MKKNKINRTQLIEALAEKLGISKTQSEKFLKSLFEIITENLKKGKEVNATGFGIFRVVKRKERMGVNPKTGKAMKIGSSVSVAWRVGKTLKEAIRKVIK
ncbi:HU family DNA-binding protein [Candidatus Gracilibacteria bacterium]|nr:HU family DNA-binding protein [Candidatus Gracilibacteria bacterium]